MKKYKWGIIGTGWISTKFCRALKKLDNAEITAGHIMTAVQYRSLDRKYWRDD